MQHANHERFTRLWSDHYPAIVAYMTRRAPDEAPGVTSRHVVGIAAALHSLRSLLGGAVVVDRQLIVVRQDQLHRGV